MRSITREEAKALGRRREQPVKAPGEMLAIWVAGKLTNPLNQGWGWAKHEHSYRRRWRERVAMALFEDQYRGQGVVGMNVGTLLMVMEFRANTSAKRVTFHASVWSKMDSDGLQAALKPVRDALVECGVISGDAERDGNKFEYAQRIDRARRGVEIRVSLLAPACASPTSATP